MHVEVLQQQLTSSQHQLEMRQAMLQQVTASRARDVPDSPNSATGRAGRGGVDQDGVLYGQGSPRSRGSSFLQSSLAVSPNSRWATGNLAGSAWMEAKSSCPRTPPLMRACSCTCLSVVERRAVNCLLYT